MARLAARQSGVVPVAQLYELGFSRQQIDVRVRRGQLHPRYHGVYAVGHTRLSLRGELLAAWFAAGPHSFLSHSTAAAYHGLRPHDLQRIELTVPVEHTPPGRCGLIVHRTTTPIEPAEITRTDLFAVATVPRVLVDVSGRSTDAELDALLTAAVHAEVFDPFAFEAALERHPRRPGIGRLKAVADWYRPGLDRKSELERMFDRTLAQRRDIPSCERNVELGEWEIDCLWREQRLALELDGRRYHTARQDFDRDRRKDTQLQLLGFRPMRVGYWTWVRESGRVIADLLAMLALGAREAA